VAWIFIRLKLRTLKNRMGTASVLSLLGFVLVWMGAISAGLLAAVLIGAGGRLSGEARSLILPIVFLGTAIVWVIGPIIAASIDDSLDPRRFETLPVSRRQLGVGLAAAGLISPGGLGTSIGIIGGSMAGFTTAASFVPALVSSVTQVVLVMVTARAVVVWLSDLLRSRRTREIVGVVTALTAAIPGTVAALINTGGIRVDVSPARALEWIAATPPGALGRSISAFADGEWILGLGGLGYGFAATAVMLWIYGRGLNRLQVVPDAPTRTRTVRNGGAFRPKWVPLPSGPVGAIAAKELRYLQRDNRLRGQLVGSLVGLVVITTLGLSVLRTDYGAFLAVPTAFFLVLAILVNQFGHDGGAFWTYVTAAPSMTEVLKGKNLAAAVFGVPIATVAGVAGAIISGTPKYLPASLLAAGGVMTIWAAIGNVTSLMGPVKIPEGSPFGNRGMSGQAFVASLVGIVGAGALAAPAVAAMAAAVWFGGPVWGVLAGLGVAGYSLILYRLSFRYVGPFSERRALSVMEVIDAD